MDNDSQSLRNIGQSVKNRLSDIKSSLSFHSLLLFMLLFTTCTNKPKDYYSLEKSIKETNQLLKDIRDEMRKPKDRQTNNYLWNILNEIRNSKEQPFGPYHLKPKSEEMPVEK